MAGYKGSRSCVQLSTNYLCVSSSPSHICLDNVVLGSMHFVFLLLFCDDENHATRTYVSLLGGPDGKPCGGWPPRMEFPCLNYSWTNATCKDMTTGTWEPGTRNSHHTGECHLFHNHSHCFDSPSKYSVRVRTLASLGGWGVIACDI